MKVLMTADAVGGVWTYAVELCRSLIHREVEVVLAVMGPPPSTEQRAVVEALPNVRIEQQAWKLEWMEQPWDDVARAGDWLLEIARRERVDVVHLNGYAHAALKWNRPVLVVAHSCVCSWWQAVHDELAPAEWDRYREVVTSGLRSADVVVSPTHAFLNTMRAHYGALPRTAVIHNASSSRALDVPSERLNVIFACGRAWDEAKNLRVLAAAARELSWTTYVAGERTSPDGRTTTLSTVKALGRLPSPQIHEWLSRVAIFAHPARYEPFGLAVLEAALNGCALVLSDLPTLRELWDGVALFAAPADEAGWRRQLQYLIEHPSERHKLSASARARAEAFAPDAMGNAYASTYRELVRDHAAHSQELAVA